MSKYGLDKFYTKEEVVDDILNKIDISKFSSVVEPSAGNGSFSKKIENVYAYDIEPEDNSIEKKDFFEIDFKTFKKPILVIGNPPFGRNGSLALSFIKHCDYADTIAFILPKSFKKISFYNKIPLNFWKIYEEDLPDYSFTFNGKDVNIPCVFQVYEKRKEEREKKKIEQPDYFSFVDKKNADLSLRRVGVNAGSCSKDTDKSKESHYFIKTEKPDLFLKLFNSIDWRHNNTVGPRSISKIELIEEINKIYRKI